MATTQTALQTEPRSIAMGPIKFEFTNYTAAVADTTLTITTRSLEEIYGVILNGIQCTAQVIHLNAVPPNIICTFDGLATARAGTLMLIGR